MKFLHIKLLSYKLTMLLALSSAGRASEFCMLNLKYKKKNIRVLQYLSSYLDVLNLVDWGLQYRF